MVFNRKNKSMQFKGQQGQSLFEVLFAFTIMSLIIVAIVGLATVSIRNSSFARNKTVASTLSSKTMEWLRAEKDKSWSSFLAKSSSEGTPYCLATLPDTQAPDYSWGASGRCSGDELISKIFLREVTMIRETATNGEQYVKVEVSLSWIDSQGEHVVRLVTDFANWKAK